MIDELRKKLLEAKRDDDGLDAYVQKINEEYAKIMAQLEAREHQFHYTGRFSRD